MLVLHGIGDHGCISGGVKVIGIHRGGQDNDLRVVLHVIEDAIFSSGRGFRHLLGDTHGLVRGHALGLDPQLQEGLVVPVQL